MYEQQFERMMRWYRRFREIDRGRRHTMDSHNYEDEVHAFFMNCYHLKDWIKNDDSSNLKPAAKKEAEGFVKQNESLAICADLCNGLKHLKLNQPQKSGVSPVLEAKEFHLVLAGRGDYPIVSVKYHIETVKGDKDAFALATDCVAKWKGFITNSRIP